MPVDLSLYLFVLLDIMSRPVRALDSHWGCPNRRPEGGIPVFPGQVPTLPRRIPSMELAHGTALLNCVKSAE